MNCTEPGHVENSIRQILPSGPHRYSFQTTIIYTCNPGYYLLGTSTLSCQGDGTWDRSLPKCLRKKLSPCSTLFHTACQRKFVQMNTLPSLDSCFSHSYFSIKLVQISRGFVFVAINILCIFCFPWKAYFANLTIYQFISKLYWKNILKIFIWQCYITAMGWNMCVWQYSWEINLYRGFTVNTRV